MSSSNHNGRPTIVGIGGLTSEVGKTTLLCKLLKAFSGWEAIKTTRGHYRSCGKDPHTCCVSDLLSDEPTVQSGYELTFSPGKDTGRYWEAGAGNVHWVIGTDDQIEEGIRIALERVQARGVFVEGNSFTEFTELDYFVMVGRPDQLKIKTTAKRALNRVSAIYLSGDTDSVLSDKQAVREFLAKLNGKTDHNLPILTRTELSQLIHSISADADP
jgi:hypothetical protein